MIERLDATGWIMPNYPGNACPGYVSSLAET
jgi:hypothetical protein